MPIISGNKRVGVFIGAALISAAVVVGLQVADPGGVDISATCSTSTQHVPGGPDGADGCWPGATNTGVPAGVVLTEFAGSRSGGTCYLNTDNQIVNATEFTGCDVAVMAANVKITKSRINGHLSIDKDRSGAGSWSMTVEDSEIDAGTSFGSAVSNGSMIIRRSEVKGGQTIVQCTNNSSYCTIEDSWLHGQSIPAMEEQPHLGGTLNSGGPNYTLKHNTIACDNPYGCTGDIVMLPDFAPITNALIDHNLLMAYDTMAYCTYAGNRPNANAELNHDIVYRNNVFQRGGNNKCGGYGPITGWRADLPGNTWTGNTWDDGTTITPP